MKRLFRYFVQGLILAVPAVVTVYVCYALFTSIDSWLHLTIPGAGFVLTISAITLIGFIGPHILSKPLVDGFEGLIEHLPFVRLLYHSTKDLLNAFVGEKRRFDKPVIVALSADGALRGFGFVTQESLDALGLADSVTVYFPQSYAFAGNTIVVPSSRVSRLEAVSSDVMAFVVSGGVTEVPRISHP
ncbi:MAG: DUF502 domain-containing protein [Gemmatimonadaceae bacterium]